MKDFTIERYEDLCISLSKIGIRIFRLIDYFNKPSKSEENFLILRHDVDKSPKKALRMALIESKYYIKSTYYFRKKSHTFQEEIIRKIESLGHEIGYHYESLADSRGNMPIAIDLFSKNLEAFREISQVETVSMHGSSLSKHNNIDMWDYCDYEDYGIKGEAYLSIDWSNLLYFTDAGGSWNSKANRRDKPIPSNVKQKKISETNELIKLFGSDKSKNYYLNIHPDRWNSGFSWYSELITKKIRNTAKIAYNFWN